MSEASPYPKMSITGDIGSGKSVITGLLGEDTGYRLYSTGQMQREIAARRGMSTLELNRYAETHPEIDEEIDSASRALRSKPEAFIIDSRIAWNFIPESFKVYLVVDVNIAASRILSDNIRQTESYEDLATAREDIRRRRRSEKDRFLEMYDIDLLDLNNYDLVVDTSCSSPQEIATVILRAFRSWTNGRPVDKVWLPPKLLLPTREFDSPADESVVEILRAGDFYFILDGHRRASAALSDGISLLPAEIVSWNREDAAPGPSTDELVKKYYQPERVEAWERRHGFKFPVK
ncbi:MAG: AAA family ATPase [bacterium]|nr:AAA family ATPase [bacterium]